MDLKYHDDHLLANKHQGSLNYVHVLSIQGYNWAPLPLLIHYKRQHCQHANSTGLFRPLTLYGILIKIGQIEVILLELTSIDVMLHDLISDMFKLQLCGLER